jgi:hypothetical protein
MADLIALSDWFRFSDRDDATYNPTVGERIVIDRLWRTEIGKFDSIDGRCEEWLIRSVLVPFSQLEAAGLQVDSPHELTFEIGWDSEGQFSFGEQICSLPCTAKKE